MSTGPGTTSPYHTRYQRKRKANAMTILQQLHPPGKYPWVDAELAALPPILSPDFDPWRWGHPSGHRQQFAHLAGRQIAVDELLVPFLERIHQGETKLLTIMSCQGRPDQPANISFTYEGFRKLCQKVRDRHNQLYPPEITTVLYRGQVVYTVSNVRRESDGVASVWTEFFLKSVKMTVELRLHEYGDSATTNNYLQVYVAIQREHLDGFVQLWDVMFQFPGDRLVKRLRGPIKAVVLSASLTK
jgi:hypothetical protein